MNKDAPEIGFQPDAQYAVDAQQAEIARLREETARQADRIVWLDACLRQFNDQANQEIARLTAENSQLKSQIPPEPSEGENAAPEPPSTPPVESWADGLHEAMAGGSGNPLVDVEG